MSALVSIIVPVYNLEDYVENCIRSLTNQTYENIEILCIDDGSTDNSATVIKKIAEGDQRVKYIYKENGGVSSARNKGLEIANGDYIMFVDGDDYMHYQAVEILIKEMVKGSYDLLSSDFDLVDTLECETDLISEYQVKRLNVVDFFEKLTTETVTTVWAKIFTRESVISFRFPDKVTNGEDTIFLYKVLESYNRIAYVDCPLYYYYQRSGSASRSAFKLSLVTMLEGFSDLCAYLNDKKSEYILSKALRMLFKMIFSIRTLSVGTENEEYVFNKCKDLGKKNVPILIKNKCLSIKDKFLFLFFMYFRRIYELSRLIQDPTMKDFYKSRKKNRKV